MYLICEMFAKTTLAKIVNKIISLNKKHLFRKNHVICIINFINYADYI